MQPRNFLFSFGFLWTVLACTLLPGCADRPEYSLQTEAALERLDAELSNKPRYQQWRQEQADSAAPGGRRRDCNALASVPNGSLPSRRFT